MKSKILAGVAVMVAVVGLAFATEATYDYLKADNAVVMTNLAVGTMSPSKTFKIDLRGKSRFVGEVKVASSTATGVVTFGMAGAFSALPTTGYARGTMCFLTSSNKVYVASETVAGTYSWVALH